MDATSLAGRRFCSGHDLADDPDSILQSGSHEPCTTKEPQAMKTPLLTLTASAFILAGTIGLTQAQETSGGQTMQQGQQGQMMQQGQRGQRMMQQGQRGQRMMQQRRQGRMEDGKYRGRHAAMMRHGMGRGMGYGMGYGMGHGMGHGAVMRIVFALMDADGDGALSRQEMQEAQDRIFNHIDADGDGRVTMEEIRAFYRGARAAVDADEPDADE
jgi:hypothetical protein